MGPQPFGIIYLALNVVRCKAYVGQTVTSIRERWRYHLYHAKRDYQYPLYHAIRKYGEGAFVVVKLNEAWTRCELNEQEVKYIWSLKTLWPHGYNLDPGGKGRSGFKHSEETKRKISVGNKGRILSAETRQKISRSHFGICPSEETRDLMSRLAKGRINSESTRKKISIALSKKERSPEWCAAISRGKIRDRCKRGHPFIGDNFLLKKHGARVCRICNMQRHLEKRQDAGLRLSPEVLEKWGLTEYFKVRASTVGAG